MSQMRIGIEVEESGRENRALVVVLAGVALYVGTVQALGRRCMAAASRGGGQEEAGRLVIVARRRPDRWCCCCRNTATE